MHVFLLTLWPILKGVSLAVLGFKAFAFQHEVLKGEDEGVSVLIGFNQAILASVLLETLNFVVPIGFWLYTGAWLALSVPPIAASIFEGAPALFKRANGFVCLW